MEYLLNCAIPYTIVELQNYSKVIKSIQSMFFHHMELG